MVSILHTESSQGWGGQEIRILREAIAMRKRGHKILFAINKGGKLIEKARDEGFLVYEVPFRKPLALKALLLLLHIFKRHEIQIVNTHSSLDAWIGGLAARIAKKRIIRTRHLSTPIKTGLNSCLLYKNLADFVVTTSSCIIPLIARQAKLDLSRLKCVPTGIDPAILNVDPDQVSRFRAALGVQVGDTLVGTACFVRSWKGIDTLLKAAQLLRHHTHIKWVIVGGGYVETYRPKIKALGVEATVTMTGHLDSPFTAIAAMDIFTLLSTAHEGISQASLQAAFLCRPLITTPVGGLPEVCLNGKTGIIVPPFSPEATAEAVLHLAQNPSLRQTMGQQAQALVLEKFTFKQTIDHMEGVYTLIKS